jgi:predicted DNA binding CopG/RHH family protein
MNFFSKQSFPAEKQQRNILEIKMTKSKKAIILDEYESEILEAFENGELKLVEPKTDFQTIARNTMKKNRKINIRISENDLSALQRKAAREGMPYQTLIGSVLHKFASGFLKEA